ncbi:ATPase, T2SS/T4P/T4SS family (plasmid) [Paenibacillus urinalis]|uniref:ATPase, T2SS/T4P/T4SS family n=1 Tax=Paenibacillus urinalis TaxID=521520 RepID=A0AAX3N6D7_9BACL|nr:MULTISPECIES: ATPase, T2SS/T4P/T4SS family [Paenibacillus]MCM3130504.1 Flp pilus assembly complex ATPase component TadA [Paenibacillus sp. MER 78]WDH85390.1 ATPase, T2SS/T4P/T4SS family [Paenibacillus urinalis]WDH95171.1 ATPase, T2SS/T4P/T4SS family [Paenibacillus urinalis]WDI05356.1 ATPase, T2SS/T4P/T4SS family [Paenibacillus urinalis]
MGTTLNYLIIVLILIGLILFLTLKLRRKPVQQVSKKDEMDRKRYEIDQILGFVKRTISDFINTNLLDLGLSDEEYERRKAIVVELEKALKNANTGDIQEKVYLKQYIYDLLERKYGINEENINWIIPFNDPKKLSDQDKFDILLHLYKKKFGFKGLEQLISQYQLDELKSEIEDGTTESYIITSEEINKVFKTELANTKLDFQDRLSVVVQRVYSQYKGYGVIDDILNMRVDGVSGGVSGVPSSMQLLDDEVDLMNSMKKIKHHGYESVWIFYKGKSIHLSFLSFNSELELKRIVNNIYKYDNPSQMTEQTGFKVNELKDGSRVVVVRPPFSESWAFWVRKFDLPNMSLENLISDETAENAELPRELMKFLMKGARITAITGPQGSGKTSLMMAAVKYIPAVYNLRIQEMAFELNLRKLYPQRNTIAFRETDYITGQQGLDLQKKTDGTVNLLGEVATDEVAAWMIKMGQVASLFTVFTHHAKTFRDLMWSLRNSLINTQAATDQKTAEEQVAKVIELDVHVERSNTGHRYIERITECIYQEHDDSELLEIKSGDTLESKMDALIAIKKEELLRKTGRVWKDRNIVEYLDGKYVAGEPLSKEKVQQMLAIMPPKDASDFKAFLNKHWGHVSYD